MSRFDAFRDDMALFGKDEDYPSAATATIHRLIGKIRSLEDELEIERRNRVADVMAERDLLKAERVRIEHLRGLYQEACAYRDSFESQLKHFQPVRPTHSKEGRVKFRTKPCEIEAEQFTEENKNRAFHFVRCNCSADVLDGKPVLRIQTLEGLMTATLGDWIVKGLKGEFYPVKPEIFAMKYEQIDPPSPKESL